MSTDQANAENYRVPDELLPEPPDDLDYDDYDDYWANPPETPDELNSMVANYNAPPDTGETDSKGSIADKVVTLAEERYTFGISEDGATFGRRAGSPVARMLRGGNTSLRSELANALAKPKTLCLIATFRFQFNIVLQFVSPNMPAFSFLTCKHFQF